MDAPEQEQQKQLLKILLYTVKHFFGSITKLFTRVTDPRLPAKTDYPLDCAVFVAILMFLFRLGSRRQINYKLRDNAASVQKVMELFDVANLPHSDTLNYLFKRLNVAQVQQVLSHMSYLLIRKKVFQDYRLLGYYTIAGDGTGMLSFSSRHCPHCLVYHHKHGTCYYCPFKKIVSPFRLPLPFPKPYFKGKRKGGGRGITRQNLFKKALPSRLGCKTGF